MIGEILQGNDVKIIVQLKEFKGNNYVDVRKHFKASNGDMIPMKKGISIPVSQLSDAITLLEKAECQLKQGAKL